MREECFGNVALEVVVKGQMVRSKKIDIWDGRDRSVSVKSVVSLLSQLKQIESNGEDIRGIFFLAFEINTVILTVQRNLQGEITHPGKQLVRSFGGCF